MKSKVFVQSEWMATTNQKPIVKEKSYTAKKNKKQRCIRCDKIFLTPSNRIHSNIICPACNKKEDAIEKNLRFL